MKITGIVVLKICLNPFIIQNVDALMIRKYENPPKKLAIY